jgi:hypothetical protein
MVRLNLTFLTAIFMLCIGPSRAQQFNEILGRPTDSSVTMSILFNQPVDVYWEYGTASGAYTAQTTLFSTPADEPLEADFTGLASNTRYYYRSRYRAAGSVADFLSGPERTFITRRPRGSSFSFAVEADPHLDTNTIPASLTLTMQNMLSKQVDFMVDLGDNFLSEKYVLVPGQQLPVANYKAIIRERTALFRPYFGTLCHSAPLFLTLGNHEGELGWKITGTDSSMPVVAANMRKLYYPNPYPNSFYSGNDSAEAYVGLRENYYAWEWGDALFMVIDPYWYTRQSQRAGWGWTLGKRQFDWFKNTISSSNAKFKFIFCHQLVGGNGNDARGGIEYADLFENGGRNTDSSWGFETQRPHWEEPLHALMLENKASVYFHGHDHCYAAQNKDGIIYQEVPQPSARNINTFTGSGTGYGYVNGTLLPSRGFLLVTVTPDSAVVEYIKTFLPNEENATRRNLDVAHRYVIKDAPPALSTTYRFIGTGRWDIAANWENGSIPPALLPSGSSIIIDPATGGYCELNRVQVIATGATIEVRPGKRMVMPGTLIQR